MQFFLYNLSDVHVASPYTC